MPAACAARCSPSEGQYRNLSFHRDCITQTSRSKQLVAIAQKINTVDGVGRKNSGSKNDEEMIAAVTVDERMPEKD
ncbi:hypothetical protein TNCV_4389211 [Trichonephila clavipes]|nr:hypothetical protein TNCV_4389211 [Trichonephila clavipes]